MPNYNGARFIAKTIESVLQQTYLNWELIIVDDCSTDSSIDIIEPFLENSKIRLIKATKNFGGPAGPRNIGINQSKGDYIALLDSDDVWEKQKLEFQMDYMLANNVRFTSTMRNTFSRDTDLIDHKFDSSYKIKKISYQKILFKNYIVTSSVLIEKKYLSNVSFNESKEYSAVEDFDFFLQILKKGISIHTLKLPMTYYRFSDQNISKQKVKMSKKMYRLLSDNVGFIKAHYYFCTYLVLSVIYLIKAR